MTHRRMKIYFSLIRKDLSIYMGLLDNMHHVCLYMYIKLSSLCDIGDYMKYDMHSLQL